MVYLFCRSEGREEMVCVKGTEIKDLITSASGTANLRVHGI